MIDEAVCLALINQISSLASLASSCLSCEIQEGGQFVLVSVDIPNRVKRDQLLEILKIAQTVAGQTLPWRAGANSWMVNATQDGHLIESVFGGDILSPEAGLL
jgi:hypothetical protein